MKKLKILLLLTAITAATATAQEWEFVGLDSMAIKQLYVSGDTIYAGTDVSNGVNINAGLYFTSDRGINWLQLDSALGNNTVYGFKIISPETLFILKAGTLYKTTNHGETWEVINNISNNPIRGFGISPFNVNEMYGIDLGFAGGGTFNNLYKSTNGGENWEMLGPFPSSSHGNALAFAFDLTDSMNLYVVVDDHWTSLYLFKSTDKGDNWFYVSTPPTFAGIHTDYFIPNRIYQKGQYISNDGGLNWFEADSGLTDTSYHLSFYQDKLTTRLLYNLRTDGIYYSSNETIFWQLMKVSKTLPIDFQNMRNMLIEPVRKELYLGTTEGIYKTIIITSVNEYEKKDLDFSLSQNYPNPFNPSTTIKYQIRENGFVTLKVYNILGKEVATLVNQQQQSGRYEVNFNATNLASGVYLYRLRVNDYVDVKKMLLLK